MVREQGQGAYDEIERRRIDRLEVRVLADAQLLRQ
jgi:hypothetical protein